MLGPDKYSGSSKVQKALVEQGCTPLVVMGCAEIELEEVDVSVLPWSDSVATALDALVADSSSLAKAAGGESAQGAVVSASDMAAAAGLAEVAPVEIVAGAEPPSICLPVGDTIQPIPDSASVDAGGASPAVAPEVADAMVAMMQHLALISAAETTAEREAQYEVLAQMLEATTGAAASPP